MAAFLLLFRQFISPHTSPAILLIFSSILRNYASAVEKNESLNNEELVDKWDINMSNICILLCTYYL